jgi:5-methylcytosine-specific restriction endonuclease McrA
LSGREEEISIPHATRAEIIERDASCCRMCGVFAEIPHVHHVVYRSQGGKNVAENLVSLDWKCHERVHARKPLWLPILQQVALTDGVNGIQLLRWYQAKEGCHAR